ncbi:MAG: HEAT repeat domain-containing protein [Elusimicrobia bacterium]|nr:HEAT repeat domain-containing protein [Elusimicrobiota bacterium]
MPAAARVERIESAVKGYAERLAEEAAVKMRPAEDPAQSIMELNSLKYRFEDMLAAVKLMELENQGDIERALDRDAAEVDSALIARSDALAQKILSALPRAADAAWHGRTAVVPVGPDGSAVALKFAKLNKSVEGEGAGLERAGRFGVDAPAALPSRDGYVRPISDQSPQAEYGTAFMAYLLPGKLAGEFFSYLGDLLPKDWGRKQKTQAVRSSALKAVDGMLRLHENGWYHETLAPLSHSEVDWQWDYWRPAVDHSVFELSRFGPTSIHNWVGGLSYANIRLSGLADFEHLKTFDTRSSDNKQVQKIVGQNIFELSMLVMRAGYRNKLGAGPISEILAEVLQRHAAGISGERPIEIRRSVLLPLVTGVVRRFYAFSAIADAMPRFLVRRFNDAVSRVSNRAMPAGAALVMIGEIVHPLIMDVIKPYVEALRSGVADSVYWNATEKPSGAPYRDRLVFSEEKGSRFKKIVLLAAKPVLALLFGFETAPYLGSLGRFRRPWIWQHGADQDAQVRRKRSAALQGRQDAGSLALIQDALADQDVDVRRYAAIALEGRQDTGSPALIEKALADQDAQVRRYAADALIGRQDTGSLALIEKALDHQNEDVRRYAASALKDRQDAGSLALIEKALAHQDVDVRRNAAVALEGRRDAGSLELIAKALAGQADELVRHNAAWALVGRRDPGSLALIEKTLADEDPLVGRYAAEALKGR